MVLRMTTLAGVLLALLLVTEARKYDFLPSGNGDSCNYVGPCSNDTSNEDCMAKCSKNGYNPIGAFCSAIVNPTCCCFKDKKSTVNTSDDDQYCHYLGGGCADKNECMTKCANNGFHAGAACTPIESVACCCTRSMKNAANNIP